MTLITNKYEYQKLKRVEENGKRRYATPGGPPVASVTTILDGTKDKTHLIAWRKRVGEVKAQEITTEAAGRGTRMHKYLEDYIDTGEWPIPGSNPYAQQAHKMATVIKVHALGDINEIWGSEVPLYIPKLYAGTTDLVGVYKGHDAILDFKQTNKPKKGEWVEDYYLQLTAYALAHNEVHGTDIKHGHIFMCSQNCEYQQFDLSPEPDPYFGRTFDDWCNEWWERVYKYYEQNS
jgi:genome maintenance exonuclease 1